MEIYLDLIIGYLIMGIEAAGALVVVIGALRTFFFYFLDLFTSRHRDISSLRLMLGQSMIMGLEFLVAADILRTATSPTWNDILFLLALIIMRTLLNYLLEWEMEHILCETE